MDQREVRAFTDGLRLEARQEGEARRIVGHASVFNSPALIAGMWNEQVAPGAFRATISNDDIRALIDHDPTLILGRNRAGTLRLEEDDRGLFVEIDPPDTQAARDVMTSIERGDITGMSITFRAKRQEWDVTVDPPLRTLKEVELFDVSVVTFPAFDQTDVALRSLELHRRRKNFAAAARRKAKAGIGDVHLGRIRRILEAQSTAD